MRIIACLDDYGGMLFNSRRQSRDRMLIDDIMMDLRYEKLYILDYSKILFSDYEGRYEIVDDFSALFDSDSVCFVENVSVASCIDKVDRVTLYHWNRTYPRDFSFDVDLAREGFHLTESCEFEGYSHENIRKEIYER